MPDGGLTARSGDGAERHLQAGRVGRPHGLDGSFYVTGAVTALLTTATSITVAGRARTVVRRAGTDERPIVRLADVEDRDAAAALRGEPLQVAAGAAPALGPGEWWAHELEGCLVSDGPRRVGVVRRLIELPSCEALEVQRDDGGELLVPMVRDAIRQVDVANGVIDVDLRFLGGS
jgi:16S rRNA processing protein RimM